MSRDDRPRSRRSRVLLLPKDTNAYGTIFGGVILSHIDLASADRGPQVAPHRYVTKAMREVEFHEPVFVGDIVSFYTETVRVGRTSVTVRVVGRGRAVGCAADARRIGHGEVVKVTEAEVVLVAVDAQGRPVDAVQPGIRTSAVMNWISTPRLRRRRAVHRRAVRRHRARRRPVHAGAVRPAAGRARSRRVRAAPASSTSATPSARTCCGTRLPQARSSRSSATRSTSRCRWSR